MNRLLTAVGICTALALSGCAETVWTKDDFSPQTWQADRFDCKQKVMTMYGGLTQMGVGDAILARGDFSECLESKGYRQMSSLSPENQVPAPQPGTPEDVWRSKSGGAVYPKPTRCVGQGCVPSTEQ